MACHPCDVARGPAAQKTRFGGKFARARTLIRRSRSRKLYLSSAEDGGRALPHRLRSFARRQTGERGPTRKARVKMRNGCHVVGNLPEDRMDRDSLSA